MKPSAILLASLAGILSLAPCASVQGASQKSSSRVMTSAHRHTGLNATTFTVQNHTIERRPPPREPQQKATGVIPRALQGEEFLQMLNPFAPQKYGAAEQNTVLDPEKPDQRDGIKLLSISF